MTPLDYQNRDDARKDTGLLRSLFGPSKKEVWRQLAEQISGRFVDGGFVGRDKVVATTSRWTVTLDTYEVSDGEGSTTYTRMRAPYVNKDGFRFTIYRAGLFSAIGKMLGMQDIEVGDPASDDAFIVKSSSEAKIRALLSNDIIRALMHDQPRIWISVKDDEGWFGVRFPEGVDELCFRTFGVVKDLERLHNLFELFAVLLQQLCHIGSAYEDDPGIVL
jgi:hypothetical protein